jgi:hypothetical protein
VTFVPVIFPMGLRWWERPYQQIRDEWCFCTMSFWSPTLGSHFPDSASLFVMFYIRGTKRSAAADDNPIALKNSTTAPSDWRPILVAGLACSCFATLLLTSPVLGQTDTTLRSTLPEIRVVARKPSVRKPPPRIVATRTAAARIPCSARRHHPACREWHWDPAGEGAKSGAHLVG